MKKIHLLLSLFFLALSPLQVFAMPSSLGHLKGKILLQVEQNGEAWYVQPDTEERYYLGRPQAAFEIMRKQGLGITNADLAKIPESGSSQQGDLALRERLKGKILLQVQSKGEAWYVYPGDLKRYYLGRPSEAFSIMRDLGLGVSDANLSQISIATDSQHVAQKVEVVQETVVTQPVSQPKPEITIQHPFDIIGISECQPKIDAALDLLYQDAPEYYEWIQNYIKVIDCQEDGSGMYVWEQPPRFRVGRPTWSNSDIWLAGVIVHDACHSWQYQRYLAQHPLESVPSEQYFGEGPETECTDVQIEALTVMHADQYFIDYLHTVISTRYWEAENRNW